MTSAIWPICTRWWQAHNDTKILHPLRDEPWGQRHFIGVDPQGVMVDVIELIPPSPEFLAQYR
jgi:hypothetical protein